MKNGYMKRMGVPAVFATLSLAILAGCSTEEASDQASAKQKQVPEEVKVVAENLSQEDLSEVFTQSQKLAPKVPFILKEEKSTPQVPIQKPEPKIQPEIPGDVTIPDSNQPQAIDEPIIQNIEDQKKLQLAQAKEKQIEEARAKEDSKVVKETESNHAEEKSIPKKKHEQQSPSPKTEVDQTEKLIESIKKVVPPAKPSVSQDEVNSLKSMIEDLQQKLAENQKALQKEIQSNKKEIQKSIEKNQKKIKKKQKALNKKDKKKKQDKKKKKKKEPENKAKEDEKKQKNTKDGILESTIYLVKPETKEKDIKQVKEKTKIKKKTDEKVTTTVEKSEEKPKVKQKKEKFVVTLDPKFISALKKGQIQGFLYQKHKDTKADEQPNPLLQQMKPEDQKQLQQLKAKDTAYVLYKKVESPSEKTEQTKNEQDSSKQSGGEIVHPPTDKTKTTSKAKPESPQSTAQKGKQDSQMGFIFYPDHILFFTIENGEISFNTIQLEKLPTKIEKKQSENNKAKPKKAQEKVTTKIEFMEVIDLNEKAPAK